MLTLADSLRIGSIMGSFTVYRDVGLKDGARSYSSAFYVVPDAPRLCRDAQGEPALNFLWYRGPLAPDKPALRGALLTLGIDLSLTEEEKRRVTQELQQRLSLSAVELRPLPVVSGTVALSFAGESGGGELALQVAGSGPARLTGWEQATFFVELSSDGAALLEAALRKGLAVLHARYELGFEYRLDQVQLRVWCDPRKAWEDASHQPAGAPPDVAALRQRLAERGLAGVELLTTAEVTPEHRAALEQLGNGLLEAALKNALFSAGALRPGDAALDLALNHTFTESYAAEQQAVVEGLLNPTLTPEQIDGHVRRVDLQDGFFRVLEVQVLCTADFGKGAVSAVTVRLVYDETGPTGRVQRTGEFVFRDSATAYHFRSELAAPELRRYSCTVEIYYDGSAEPTGLDYGVREDTVLVLDLERLGMLQVEVTLADVPFDQVRSAVVELEYPARALSRKLFLDAQAPAGSWRAVVRDYPLRPYRFRPAWILQDDRRVEGPWEETQRPRVFLDAPAEVRQGGRVEVLSAGDFSALAQVVLSLRHGDEEATFTFTRPGEAQTWRPRVAGAERASFRYQVRQTIVYQDGRVQQEEWRDEDRAVLVVRDSLRFEVLVEPRLLDLGGGLSMAILVLEHRDPAVPFVDQHTFTLTDRAAPARWGFRLAAVDRHTYRYQLTLVPAAGPRRTLDWQEGEEEILVLRAPQE